MEIDVISDLQQFREIQSSWDSLHKRSKRPTLPLTHGWLLTWWEVFGSGKSLSIFRIYEGSQLIAIAPFMLEESRYRRFPVTIQRFMANGHSPYCDLIVYSGLSTTQYEQVIDLILSRTRADILQFSKVPEDSFTLECLQQKSKQLKFRYGVKKSLTTPIINIGGAWSEFFKSKKRKFRSSLNNKLNRFKKSEDYTIECLKIPDSQHCALKEIVEVSKNSWKQKIHNDLGSNDCGRAFLNKLADAFGSEDRLMIWMLRHKGQAIAFEYHLNFNSIVYPIRADFNENYRSISPGSVLECTALKSLFDNRSAKEYYSCADDYWYLNNWTQDARHHYIAEVFHHSIKATFLHFLEYKLIPPIRATRDRLDHLKESLHAR